MSERGYQPLEIAKWLQGQKLYPLRAEEFVPFPIDSKLQFDPPITVTTNQIHYVPVNVDSWDEESLEDLAKEAKRLDRDLKVDAEIEIAPGFGLMRFLGSIVPQTFRQRELEALHSDAIHLYFDKLNAGDKWGALRVKWSMRLWMLWTVFGGAVGAVISVFTGRHKASK